MYATGYEWVYATGYKGGMQQVIKGFMQVLYAIGYGEGAQ